MAKLMVYAKAKTVSLVIDHDYGDQLFTNISNCRQFVCMRNNYKDNCRSQVVHFLENLHRIRGSIAKLQSFE